jgi:prolipoprotein diacylglyceryltransferase
MSAIMTLLCILSAAVAVAMTTSYHTTAARANHFVFVNNISIIIFGRLNYLLIVPHDS